MTHTQGKLRVGTKYATDIYADRVRIGCAYVAPHPHHDADADHLQDWLLGNPRALWAMPNWMRRIWAWL